MSRGTWRHALTALSIGAAFVSVVACSSSKPPVEGSGVAVPPPGGNVVDGGADASADGGKDASAEPHTGYPVPHPRPPPNWPDVHAIEDFEQKTTPEEKTIMSTCPRRAWSTNVPDRACTQDSECGEGFCDRDHCSPIYTCGQTLGTPCLAPHSWLGLAIDGRCRSCVSDEECEKYWRVHWPDLKHYSRMSCHQNPLVPGPAKGCYSVR